MENDIKVKKMVKVKEDLTGKVFGRLTVLHQIEDYIIPKSGVHQSRWLCQCNCCDKTLVKVTGGNLKGGKVKSCGCLTKEKSSERFKQRTKENCIDFISEDYAIGYTTKGEPFWFDKEDFEKIKNYCWYYDNHGYLVARERGTNNRISFHVLVMSPIPDGMIVDHKKHPPRNGQKFDNRKSNLEIKTNSQNMMNASLYIHNTSGKSGVNFEKASGKWRARIGINGKRIELGLYETKEDAIIAREKAEIKYYGNYRYDAYNA